MIEDVTELPAKESAGMTAKSPRPDRRHDHRSNQHPSRTRPAAEAESTKQGAIREPAARDVSIIILPVRLLSVCRCRSFSLGLTGNGPGIAPRRRRSNLRLPEVCTVAFDAISLVSFCRSSPTLELKACTEADVFRMRTQ
jgi:hypothetical protein